MDAAMQAKLQEGLSWLASYLTSSGVRLFVLLCAPMELVLTLDMNTHKTNIT